MISVLIAAIVRYVGSRPELVEEEQRDQAAALAAQQLPSLGFYLVVLALAFLRPRSPPSASSRSRCSRSCMSGEGRLSSAPGRLRGTRSQRPASPRARAAAPDCRKTGGTPGGRGSPRLCRGEQRRESRASAYRAKRERPYGAQRMPKLPGMATEDHGAWRIGCGTDGRSGGAPDRAPPPRPSPDG